MIISGYQGIGKSTLARESDKFVDLESSHFIIDEKRSDNWYIIYCRIAESLSQQGYDVFVSSHKEVRDYLSRTSKERLVLIYPAKSFKDEWIEKLKNRFFRDASTKNLRALRGAQYYFDSNVIDLMCQPGFIKVEITSEEYSLKSILDLIREGKFVKDQVFETFNLKTHLMNL